MIKSAYKLVKGKALPPVKPKPKHNIRGLSGKFRPAPADAIDAWLASKKPKA